MNAESSCGAVMVAAARFWRFVKDENDFEIVPFNESQARAALNGPAHKHAQLVTPAMTA
jgi:hypothetical protein